MLQIDLWKRIVIWGLCIIGLFLALPNAFYTRVEGYNDTKAGLISADAAQDGFSWPSFLPASLVNLGLDLRGGAHLLAEVQVEDVYAARMKALWPDLRDVLRAERAKIGTIRLQKGPTDQLRVKISQAEQIAHAVSAVETLSKPVVSLSNAGARDLEVTSDGDTVIVTLSEAERALTDQRTLQQALEIIRRRVDEVGTREPTIQRQGARRVLIQVPGIGSASELKELIGTTAQLTFQPVISRSGNPDVDPGYGNEVLPDLTDAEQFYVLEAAPVVTGEDLVDAQPSFDQNGRPAVNFRFNPSGGRRFGDYTADNIGSPFAIVLDGEVISAPTIQSHISGGSGIITGNFSVEESTNLAVLLRAGALPAGLEFLEERTIGLRTHRCS